MQLKNTEGPSQGSLPPRVAEAPPTPRCEVGNTARGPTLLRHRCPLSCSHSHSHSATEGSHRHPSNNERRQGMADVHTQPYHSHSHRHHHHHHHHQYVPYQPSPPQSSSFQSHPQQSAQQQGVSGSQMISRGGVSAVTECRVPPLSPSSLSLPSRPSSPNTTNHSLQPPLIPVDFRRRAIKYMSTRLHVGVNVEEKSVREIERRILNLEEQVYKSSVSQDEYVSKLASRLAAILQHLDKCRSPRTPPVAHQSQQEPVM